MFQFYFSIKIILFIFLLHNKPCALQAQTMPLHPALIASIYYNKNMLDSAIYYYNQAIELKKNDDKWFIQRGLIYLKLNNTEKAIHDFLKAEKLKPGSASYYLAISYAMLKDTSRTLEYIEKNLRSMVFKVDKNSIFNNSQFDFLKQTSYWKNILNKEWYSKTEYYEGEMRFYLKSQNWMAIINTLADMERSKIRINAEIYYMAGYAYHQLQNFNAAVTNYKKAISLNKNISTYYYHKSKSELELKRYSNAIEDINKAISISPENIEYYIQRNITLFQKKKYNDAIEEINKLLPIFSESLELRELAARCNYKIGAYITALEHINFLISSNEKDTAFLALRARIYTKTNLYNSALYDYTKLLEITNYKSNYYIERGFVHYKMKNNNFACSDWRNAEKKGNVYASNLLWQYCK